MAKYPVEISDTEGTNDAINYLLSGPSGLGQNFKGSSAYVPSDLTGNFRPPFSILAPTAPAYANLYVPPIALSTAERLDGFTWKFTFASPMVAPFALGQGPFVAGVVTADNTVILNSLTAFTVASGTKALTATTNYYSNVPTTVLTGSGSGLVLSFVVYTSPSEPYANGPGYTNIDVFASASGSGFVPGDTVRVLGTAIGGASPANDLVLTVVEVTNDYNGDYYSGPGVVECTTTHVIIRTQTSYPDPGPGTGGTISLTSMGYDISTDSNAKVVVAGATDRVFISGQLSSTISYDTASITDLTYRIRLNRLKGFITSDPSNPEYRFVPDATIAEKTFTFNSLAIGTGTTSEVDAIFTAVIDEPDPGYYWYIIEIRFDADPVGLEVTSSRQTLRSLSVQVVKE